MTVAHVEKFAELVAKDPALLAKLGLDKVNVSFPRFFVFQPIGIMPPISSHAEH